MSNVGSESKFTLATTGFTLLETVVALSVILAVVVGPVTLITKGIFNFVATKNKLVAANLAQEGIELIRLVRDNNVICDFLNGSAGWAWNRDPEGGNLTNTSREVDANSSKTINCGAASLSTPRLPLYSGQPLRFNTSTGFYGYGGDQETVFVRKVDIRVPPDNPDSGIPASDQMDIISTITWNEHGTPKSLVVRERIYNWR
ncbi:MAG: type II secretion system protein [Candidatus Sungiibacteriota bacterium]|uniref:Type II secretion system protein n=1 Tax=Candidatus Sungiibacteriota bacterium TaxID=2750080 RepID=A0A7T5RK97_9BACT|nr:MAG: type II secretion system protein [Candidatus Sungbacteria bacterium]